MKKREQTWVVLLCALIDIGGKGSKQEVLEYIQRNDFWYQNDSNNTNLPSRPNEYRWRNDISYGRQHMVDKGCILNEKKDCWEITNKGRLFFNDLAQKLILEYPFEEMRFTESFYRRLLNDVLSSESAADQKLLEDISLLDTSITTATIPDNTPKPKGNYIVARNRKQYKRDPKISRNALLLAGYRCEIDHSHESFLCKNRQHLYMEPHHLVPMSVSDQFEATLDREQNIFCLCSNCHNRIHYGTKEDVRQMIEKLFCLRSKEICTVLNRKLTVDDIFEMYNNTTDIT